MAIHMVTDYLSELDAIFDQTKPENLRCTFDLPSDTLYVEFDQSAANSVNVYVDGGWMVRVNRQTNHVLGLQIENALACEGERFSFLYDVVLLTEPEGFEPSPVERAMRKAIVQHPADTISRFRDHIPELAAAGD